MHVHTPPACKEITQKQEFTCRSTIKKTPVEKGKVKRSISFHKFKNDCQIRNQRPKIREVGYFLGFDIFLLTSVIFFDRLFLIIIRCNATGTYLYIGRA